MPYSRFSVGLFLSALVAFGAPKQARAEEKPATVFQFSTLPALSAGLYEGELTFGELLKHGNFGVGTFDALDGEMVLLDGKAWRIRADGQVSAVDKKVTTPFAIITRFKPEKIQKVTAPVPYSSLHASIPALFPTKNATYAVAIKGTFSRLKVRSVPGQTKPYKPLAEVVKTQSVWEWQDIKGTLVGFRFPSFLSDVNLADLHFHFISDDKQRGGHLLDCELKSGEIQVQTLRGFQMQLPSGSSFTQANLEADQSATLKATEQAGGK